MRVAVVYTKYTDYAIEVMDNFYWSIKMAGDQARKIKLDNYSAFSLEKFDLQIQICKHNPKYPSANDGISGIRQYCGRSKTKKLIVDTEHILPEKPACKWFSVGFGDIKGGAVYNNENSPSDRWDQLKLPILPWKKTGKYILVLGQYENGVSTAHINVMEWFDEVISYMKQYDIPIKFRMHPNQKILPGDRQKYIVTQGTTLREDIKDAVCVIGRTTNALNYAPPMGVPTITPDPMSTAFPISCHDLDLDKLKYTDDRVQWCYNLAYTQWSTQEIRDGKCWQFVRQFV